MIFSNVKDVVDILKKHIKTTWNVNVDYEDIWNMFLCLDHVMFLYISKRFNIAHNLAKVVISLSHEL